MFFAKRKVASDTTRTSYFLNLITWWIYVLRGYCASFFINSEFMFCVIFNSACEPRLSVWWRPMILLICVFFDFLCPSRKLKLVIFKNVRITRKCRQNDIFYGNHGKSLFFNLHILVLWTLMNPREPSFTLHEPSLYLAWPFGAPFMHLLWTLHEPFLYPLV